MIAVVGRLELQVHQVHGAERRGQEEDLHGCIIQRDEVGEQVQVARREHAGEQNLRFS